MPASYTLFGRRGWGSQLVEAQLAYYRLPFVFEEVDDLFKSAAARERLAAINPLAQIPTLLTPEGEVMTESAAITLHLADVIGGDALAPSPGDATRPRFLRWLVFIVANIYPTFTYADDPARFVAGTDARAAFGGAIDLYRERLWTILERETGGPWFLGGRFSALDIFLAGMTHWRPRRAWFAEHCPAISQVAVRTDALPELEEVWLRNSTAGAE